MAVKQQAFAASSRSNMCSQIRSYFLFCGYFHFTPFPATAKVLSLYAQFLSRSFQTVSAVKACIQAVKQAHQDKGLEVGAFQSRDLYLTLRGLARQLTSAPRQAHPLNKELLLQIFHTLDLKIPGDLNFWVTLLLGFFSLVRISNLVKTNKSEFQLLRRQILVSPSMLLLVVNKTKTIQFGERTLKIPVLAIPGSPLCPVSWYKTLVNTIPAPGDLPALIIPEKGELKPYTYSRFQKRLKSSLSAIGKDPNLFSSHSMRRGGATSAFNAGVPSDIIQKQGDWASEAYLGYIKMSHVSRLKLAESMVDLVQSSADEG